MIRKIRENLYLGSLSENRKFNGVKLCVLEHDKWDRNSITPDTIILPIIETKDLIYSPKDCKNIVNDININIGVSLIDEYIKNETPVLVHCQMGRERSALMVIYYLHKKENLDLKVAYKEVKRLKPNIQNRLYWLNEEIK